MSPAPTIAVFDIATVTGICVGKPGGRPEVGSWDMGRAGTQRPARFSYFSDLCERFFANRKPEIVRYEAPLPLRVMMKIGTSEDVMLLLRGAIGVLEATAWDAGIRDIASFGVQDARKYVTGQRTWARGLAKAATMKAVRTLGVDCQDDNQADAAAGWYLACGKFNPRLSHLTTPLFAGVAAGFGRSG